MAKLWHELRDPVHDFIQLEARDRDIVGSAPVQRLRYIHQLALSFLIYPGATHRRFEHVLGVAHLAGRVFDVITAHDHVSDDVKEMVPQLAQPDDFAHWRRYVRMGALCHDIGHLPFSHAGEELLPDGWTHERLSRDLILSPAMADLWSAHEPILTPSVVSKIAVGPRKAEGPFSVWEALLSEIVVGDAFGVDRMDYLLRDALHCGVAFGRFDYLRLVDMLRILPRPRGADEAGDGSAEPALGVEEGGLQAAEGLLLARYFMYSSVYLHKVRQVYNLHLQQFLQEWLPDGTFPVALDAHLAMTDNEILTAMREAAADPSRPGHDPARRILERDHFKLVYERTAADATVFTSAGSAIADALREKFGQDLVLHLEAGGGGGNVEFPVRRFTGEIESSLTLSPTLERLPPTKTDRVWVEPKIRDDAKKWLTPERRNQILHDASDATQEQEDA